MPSLPAIDTHAHLYFEKFDADRDSVIDRARDAGFVAVINIGVDLKSSRACIALAERYSGFCHAAVGLHPNESSVSEEELATILDELEQLVESHSRVVLAIGEIGLDKYWDRATDQEQERAFVAQIDLARRTDRPVVIHCREAWPRTLEMIETEAEGVRGVFHCFGGSPDEAARAIDLGWCVSFAGNVSYPKAEELRDAARQVPLDRLLLETDAPFLSPQPMRGKRNEPVFSLHTAEALAPLLGTDRAGILAATTRNARELFGL